MLTVVRILFVLCSLSFFLSSGGFTAADMESAVERGIAKALQKVQVKAVSMSKLSYSTAAVILKAIGLTCVESVPAEDLLPPADRAAAAHPFAYAPFGWPSNDEEKDTKAAVAHTQQLLTAVGVKMNQNDGFKIVDVHQHKSLLSVEIATIALNGGTDAIVIPYRTSEDWPQMQLRVLFEFKLPAGKWMETSGLDWIGLTMFLCCQDGDSFLLLLSVCLSVIAMGALNAQGVGKLLGACDWSDHPVLVVVTDLQNVYHLYWVGQVKKDGPTRMAHAKNIPPVDAWLFIRRWLMDLSSPDWLYTVDQDKRRGTGAAALPAVLIAEGFDVLKLQLKKAKTHAGTPMGDSDDNPLVDQLAILSMLPPEERFSAAYDIIHTHYPQQLRPTI